MIGECGVMQGRFDLMDKICALGGALTRTMPCAERRDNARIPTALGSIAFLRDRNKITW